MQHGGLVQAAQGDDAAPVVGGRPSINTLTPQPVVAALSPAATSSGGNGALAEDDSADAASSAPSRTASEAQGNVAELMRMIHDAKLSELRTTYNGSYGASLFYYSQEMTYYVALFQDKHFWRVIRSQDRGRAQAIYDGFAQQTAQLAEIEIRRTELQAQKAFIDNVIALSEDRAARLQADLDVARSQQAKVNDHQRQTQMEAVALRAEKDKAQMQLRQLQSQVQQLQRQTEFGLPGMQR
jgi:hypothetical protein